jgi:hypothetical protein
MDALKCDSSAFDDLAGTLILGIYGPVDRSDHPGKYKHQSPEIPLIRESAVQRVELAEKIKKELLSPPP